MTDGPMLIGTIRDPDKIRIRVDVGDLGVRRIEGELSARFLFDQMERNHRCAAPFLATTDQRQAAINARVSVIRKHLHDLLGQLAHEMAKEIEASLASQVIGRGWERP